MVISNCRLAPIQDAPSIKSVGIKAPKPWTSRRPAHRYPNFCETSFHATSCYPHPTAPTARANWHQVLVTGSITETTRTPPPPSKNEDPRASKTLSIPDNCRIVFGNVYDRHEVQDGSVDHVAGRVQQPHGRCVSPSLDFIRTSGEQQGTLKQKTCQDRRPLLKFTWLVEDASLFGGWEPVRLVNS